MLKGIFTYGSSMVGDRIDDVRAGLIKVAPNGTAPFFAMTSGMRSEPTNSTTVTWGEETYFNGRVQAGAEAQAAATSITLKDASGIIPSHILLVESTGEYVYVLDVTGNVLTVKRGLGNSTAAVIPNNAFLQTIATANEEGSAAPQQIMKIGKPLMNYVQTFRQLWSVTEDAKASKYHTGDKKAQAIDAAIMRMSEDIERALIWGKMSYGQKDNKSFLTMNGLYNMIKTNVTTVASGNRVSFKELDELFAACFEQTFEGSTDERIIYTGNLGMSVFNQLVKADTTYIRASSDNAYGMNLMKYITPFGTLILKTHPLFNASPFYRGDMLIVNPASPVIRWFRKTVNHPHAYTGVDAETGDITASLTMELHGENTCGLIRGITSAYHYELPTTVSD